MKWEKVMINGEEYYHEVEEPTPAAETASTADSQRREGDTQSGTADGRAGSGFRQGMRDTLDRVSRGARELGEKLQRGVQDLAEGVRGVFNRDDSRDPASRSARLLALLPFMEEDDLHDLVTELIADPESFEQMKLSAILPFLSSEDCDALFLACMQRENGCEDMTTVAPFVSQACLSRVVDGYLEGRYPDLDIDALYPFLKSEDIRRLFYSILHEKQTEDDTGSGGEASGV